MAGSRQRLETEELSRGANNLVINAKKKDT